jgi:hypothetical protein
MPRTRSTAPVAMTVATVCFSLLCALLAVWLMLTPDGSVWLGLAMLGMGAVLFSGIPNSRALVSGLDDEARGQALVTAGNSWQSWVPMLIGLVLLGAAPATKVAGAAGGVVAAVVVATVLGGLAARWIRRKRRLISDPDATSFSLGRGLLADAIAFLCFSVAWLSFTFYALCGTGGAIVAAQVSGLVGLFMFVLAARQYRSLRANLEHADGGAAP